MTTQKHTPTPWKIGSARPHQIIAPDSDYYTVARVAHEFDEALGEANAAFIVRACNEHELLNRIALQSAYYIVTPTTANQALLDELLGELAKARGEA